MEINCYAWAFMSNHAHFLLRAGQYPLSKFMRRLLTGYVIGFNRRHKRRGQLLQNRYKSIICQEETYLKELVRYIHFNPIRAGIVNTLEELKLFKYSGHGVLMGKSKMEWQDTDYVFSRGRQERKVKARSLLCFWASRELGMSHTSLAKKLEMSLSNIGLSVERGELIVKDGSYSLEK